MRSFFVWAGLAVALTACTPPPEQVVITDLSVSDENDFDAVAERETIESDAARVAENRERYEVYQPTEVPQRPGGLGPNIVAYALQTNNPVGVSLYTRSSVLAERRFRRNCTEFTSSDLAQIEFLSRGGPERDPRGLDPDGDGFACAWNPAPYRQALRG